MNNIYDNCEKLLGTVKNIKLYAEQVLANNTGGVQKDFFEELLEELKDYNESDIISIDYDNGMGYSIDKWDEEDVIFNEI